MHSYVWTSWPLLFVHLLHKRELPLVALPFCRWRRCPTLALPFIYLYPGHHEIILILVLLPQIFSSFPNFNYPKQYTVTFVFRVLFLLLLAIFLSIWLLYRCRQLESRSTLGRYDFAGIYIAPDFLFGLHSCTYASLYPSFPKVHLEGWQTTQKPMVCYMFSFDLLYIFLPFDQWMW